MNHFGLKKASSWTQVSSVPAKRPFHLSSLVGPTLWGRVQSRRAMGAVGTFQSSPRMQVQTMTKRRRTEGNAWRPGRAAGGRAILRDECRAERALGCGRISPRGQQAGATGEEAAEGRKCDGGAMGTKSTRDVKSVRHSKFCRCSDLGDGER